MSMEILIRLKLIKNHLRNVGFIECKKAEKVNFDW